jgi:hypothetical protein
MGCASTVRDNETALVLSSYWTCFRVLDRGDFEEVPMTSGDAASIGDQVTATADYDALRELVNQISGLLVARQRAAEPDEAEVWRQEHRSLRAALDEIEPGTPAVAEALRRWSDRLHALRSGSA